MIIVYRNWVKLDSILVQLRLRIFLKLAFVLLAFITFCVELPSNNLQIARAKWNQWNGTTPNRWMKHFGKFGFKNHLFYLSVDGSLKGIYQFIFNDLFPHIFFFLNCLFLCLDKMFESFKCQKDEYFQQKGNKLLFFCTPCSRFYPCCLQEFRAKSKRRKNYISLVSTINNNNKTKYYIVVLANQ